nr:hypothetical protein [Tanacetum cinerariifolium]
MHVIDNEETLILEEVSRSKMSKNAKDLEVIAKKISHKPIDYAKLNRLTDDFGRHFTPQQELSAEQAFWLCISNPTIESSIPLVRVKVPSKLPKASLVNENFKKLKFQLAQFDYMVKKRTTPNALTKGMFKLDLEALAAKQMHNRESHIFYIKHTQDQADILQAEIRISSISETYLIPKYQIYQTQRVLIIGTSQSRQHDKSEPGFVAASAVLKPERLKVDKHGMSEPMSYYLID